MDYENKYKELLARLQKAKENDEVNDKRYCCVIDDIVPELKESEGERIRKELLEHCKNQAEPYIQTGNECPQIQSWIAWLEKQGKRKSDPFNGVSFEYNNHIWGMCARDGGIDILYDSKFMEHIDDSQDKTATVSVMEENVDKVEPKFKVGDWVVKVNGKQFYSGSKFAQITRIDNKRYWLDSRTYVNADKIRLWTIEDAEDGDILYAKSTKLDSLYFIRILFKRENKESWESWAHCNICSVDLENWDFCSCAGYIRSDEYDFHPATKEQCDLLFSKMKEVGYEWDSKNKKLQPIGYSPNHYCQENCKESQETEQVDEYKGLTDFERVLTDICRSWIGFELGWQEYIKSNARILKNTLVKQLHAYDNPSEQEPNKMKGKTTLEALEEETVDNANKVESKESKFHEGDWVVKCTGENFHDNRKFAQITKIDGNLINFNCGTWLYASEVRLWTVRDAVKGDVLMTAAGPFIYNGVMNNNYMGAFCKIGQYGVFTVSNESKAIWDAIENVIGPATQEQVEYLLDRIKSVGRTWNPDTYSLE